MDTTLQIRTNTKIKNAAQKVFKKEGLSMSKAFNLYMQEVIRNKKVNLNDSMILDLKNSKRYYSVEEMWKDSDNW